MTEQLPAAHLPRPCDPGGGGLVSNGFFFSRHLQRPSGLLTSWIGFLGKALHIITSPCGPEVIPAPGCLIPGFPGHSGILRTCGTGVDRLSNASTKTDLLKSAPLLTGTKLSSAVPNGRILRILSDMPSPGARGRGGGYRPRNKSRTPVVFFRPRPPSREAPPARETSKHGRENRRHNTPGPAGKRI